MSNQLPIAVVGLSSLMPGSLDVEGFWRDIVGAHDLITEVPPTHWLIDDYFDPDPAAPGKTYARRGAFIPDVEFDPAIFGLPPAVLPATDTSQLLALIAAERLLADVETAAPNGRERVSVILGSSALPLLGEMSMASGRPHWLKGLRESGIEESEAQEICDRIAENYVAWQENTFPGLLSNVVAGRVANRFDLGGTNCTVDAACASALAALSVAVGELTLGVADMVITGAVDTLNDHTTYQCFSKTRALSPTGDCRPFSGSADGTILGEGVAMFALKRLADAERDGNPIFAVIRGVGSSSDGRGTAIYAPLPAGQVVALRRAYTVAGYSPDTVGLVEAHGTGTAAGDVAEVTALRQVFAADDGRTQRCALGSVKSQIGHTKACAGGAGLLKAILALHHKVLPPTLKVDRPNPALQLESSPFYLNTTARPWIHHEPHPRRAAVSSFGFGGTNFHVTLEEYVPDPPNARSVPGRMRSLPAELVALSADSPAALIEKLQALDLTRPISELGHIARSEFSAADVARLSVVAADSAELGERLALARGLIDGSSNVPVPTGGVSCNIGPAKPGAIAFLFPGQGAQYVGMGGDLAMNFPAVPEIWNSVDVSDPTDTSVTDVTFPRPPYTDTEREDQTALLTATEWAQPALAMHSLAILELLREANIVPDALAGHSAGELTALHAGGVFDARTLVRLARRRGELMREATVNMGVAGAMLAVNADAQQVSTIVSEIADVWLVNLNSPEQVVLSGTVPGIAKAEDALVATGAVTRRLRTSTAFHSPLVDAAEGPFREFLSTAEIQAPALDVYGSADAAVYPADQDQTRDRIAKQLSVPVRFAVQIEQMYRSGVRTFIEVGAGTTLTSLVGRILGSREHLAISADKPGRNGVRSFFEALGALAASGIPVDFAPLWAHYVPVEQSKKLRNSTSRSKLRVAINGTNFGRPYPPPGGAAELPPPNPPRPVTQSKNGSSSTPGDGSTVEWVNVINEIQRQTAEAQAAYQRTTSEAHAAYLQTTEASLTAVRSLVGANGPRVVVTERSVDHEVPGVTLGLVPTSNGDASRPAPIAPPVLNFDGRSPAGTDQIESAATTSQESDLESVLLLVVADKTGYPVEVLEPDMDMEADLGIDSIKRVEILSGMRQHVPALQHSAAGELTQLGSLRTLDDVLRKLREFDVPVSDHPGESALADHAVTRNVTRFTFKAVAAPAVGDAMPGLGSGPIAVTDDGIGVARRLIAELADRGLTAVLASEVAPDACCGVVFLGGLRRPRSFQDATDIQRQAFELAKAFAPQFSERTGLFVTVQGSGGSFGLGQADPGRAWLSGLGGLARTMQHEWRRASVKAIDCDFDDANMIAKAIADEITSGGPEVDVGLSAKGRVTLDTVETPLVSGSPAWLSRNPVIVASGGARGITGAALRALAHKYRCRLLLLGRTSLDQSSVGGATEQEIRETLTRLSDLGAEVRYFSLDIRDRDAVAAVIAQTRRDWGPIDCVVHGAGVLADKLIIDKTSEQFNDVFTTKVDGLHSLLEATRNDPLRAICLFSSIVAHHGNQGQADYAMANATMTGVAVTESAERSGCVVRSLAWGPWSDGMVTAPVAELLRARGIPLISTEAGSRAFVAELESGGDEVAVLLSATTVTGDVPFRVSTGLAAKAAL